MYTVFWCLSESRGAPGMTLRRLALGAYTIARDDEGEKSSGTYRASANRFKIRVCANKLLVANQMPILKPMKIDCQRSGFLDTGMWRVRPNTEKA